MNLSIHIMPNLGYLSILYPFRVHSSFWALIWGFKCSHELFTNTDFPQTPISTIPKDSSNKTLFLAVWNQFYKRISRVCMIVLFSHAHYSKCNCFTAQMVVDVVLILVERRLRVADIYIYGFNVAEYIFRSPDGNSKTFQFDPEGRYQMFAY